jgi:hypothetical protein
VSGIRLNVTSAVQEMSEGRAPDFGFVLAPLPSDREGFTAADLALLSAMTDVKLEVTTANARAAGRVGRDVVAAARGEAVAGDR